MSEMTEERVQAVVPAPCRGDECAVIVSTLVGEVERVAAQRDQAQAAPAALRRFAAAWGLTDENCDVATVLLRGGERSVTGFVRDLRAALAPEGAECEPRSWPQRVDLADIDAQREKGWPDFHPEDFCHRCGNRNVSWYVDGDTWSTVMRGGDPAGWGGWQEIICPPCFTELAVGAGVENAWQVVRDEYEAWSLSPARPPSADQAELRERVALALHSAILDYSQTSAWPIAGDDIRAAERLADAAMVEMAAAS